MAGLAGIVSRMPQEQARAALARMYDLMAHRPSFTHETPLVDAALCAGRCHGGIINTGTQPNSAGGIHVWFTGEIYNKEAFTGEYAPRGGTKPNWSVLSTDREISTHSFGKPMGFLPA